jgi:hypothetical protein
MATIGRIYYRPLADVPELYKLFDYGKDDRGRTIVKCIDMRTGKNDESLEKHFLHAYRPFPFQPEEFMLLDMTVGLLKGLYVVDTITISFSEKVMIKVRSKAGKYFDLEYDKFAKYAVGYF